jgi:lactobin A/cerein 7B family class IIb bacteriocin
MKELSIQEIKEVNGGIAPVIWFAAGVIARSAIGSAIRSTVKTAVTSFGTVATGTAVRNSVND